MRHGASGLKAEKYKIANLQAPAANGLTFLKLLKGGAWKREIDGFKNFADKAGAVHAAFCIATPDIWRPKPSFRCFNNFLLRGRCAAERRSFNAIWQI